MALKSAHRGIHFHISPEWVLPAALAVLAATAVTLCAVIPWS